VKISSQIIAIILSVSVLGSCSTYTDFTTYFNTFYNAERLLKFSEEEFEFQNEKRKSSPRTFVIEPKLFFQNNFYNNVPPFMEEYIVKQPIRQAVQVKLDSIIIKGSKILSTKGKSSYIEKTLYLMAMSYFYKEEWRPSLVKCGEMLDRFPEGDLAPDAALLMAKNFLIERNFYQGKQLLSQTVDLAWLKGRYDILSEAFRIQAEIALSENNFKEALRPYKQAIVQTDDEALKAKWQVDLAALLYRLNKLDMANDAFTEALNYKTDYVTEFEAKLYKAACLNRQKRYWEASNILDKLENDGKFKEWAGFVFAERLTSLRLQKQDTLLEKAEKFADTSFINNNLITTYYFEKAMEFYEEGKYNDALRSFAKSKGSKSIVFQTSFEMFKLLSEYDSRMSTVRPMLSKLQGGEQVSDTMKNYTAVYLYDIARIHEKLKNTDSALHYYNLARLTIPEKNTFAAKYNYAYMERIKTRNPELSDSIKYVLAEKYSKTEYGKDMMKELGIMEEFIIDTVGEIFNSATQFRRTKDYSSANGQYLKLFNNYPKHQLAPKSLYSIGWTYEKENRNVDSALQYYNLLIDKYPNSEYANDVRLTINYLLAVRSGNIPDSLKERFVQDVRQIDVESEIRENEEAYKRMEIINSKNSSIFDLKLDPTKLIQEAQQNITLPKTDYKLPDSKDIEKLQDSPNMIKEFFFKDELNKKKEGEKKDIQKNDSTSTPNPIKK
jgi:tetratricopeptide (TPR) repeat protein